MTALLRCLLLSSALLTAPAWGLTLDEAKARGWVGEQPNGYLGIVQNAPGVEPLVQQINTKRRQAYTESAEDAGVSLTIMEQRVGQRLIQRTPSGQYIRLPDGRWHQKQQ